MLGDVGLDHQAGDLLRLRLIEVKLGRRQGIPGPHGALEHDAVSGSEKHLGAAAGVPLRSGGIGLLEDETDVADVLSDTR